MIYFQQTSLIPCNRIILPAHLQYRQITQASSTPDIETQFQLAKKRFRAVVIVACW